MSGNFWKTDSENYFAFCNETEFFVWDGNLARFGNCFSLAIFGFIPAFIFAVVSAYFLGILT